MERSTVSRNAQRMVDRDDDPDDARAHVLSLTAAGERVLHQALPAWRAAQREVAALLGDAGVDAIRAMTKALPDEKP